MSKAVDPLQMPPSFSLDDVRDVVFHTDAMGHWTYLNRAWTEITGFPREESIGRVFLEYIHPDDRERNLALFEPLIQRKKDHCFHEIRYLRKEGGYRWIEVHARLTLDGNATVTGTTGTLRDVSSRRQAEDALRQREEQLAFVLEGTSDGYWDWDLPSGRLLLDRSWVERMGFDADAIGQRIERFEELIHPDDVGRVRGAIMGHLRGKTPQYDAEYRLRTRDNRWRWLHARAKAVARDERGRATRVCGTVRDIDLRHEEFERLLGAARLKSLEKHLNDVELVLRTNGDVVEANDRAAEVYGYSRDELKAMNIRGLCAPPNVDAMGSQLASVGPQGHIFETQHKQRNGTVFAAEVSSRLFEAGGVTLVHTLIRDIEQRKQSEARLRRLAAAVAQAPSSIVITDRSGDIQYVNPAFERTTGYSAAEAVGNNPRLLKSGRHDPAFYASLWASISSGKVWTGNLVNRTKEGRLFTENAVIAPVKDDSGVIQNFVAVKRDVTEELALQDALAQAQRLESVGRLAGGVAHDFNNVLTVILNCAEELRDDLADANEALRDDVAEIMAAAGRARDLTRQLLTFARRQPVSPVPLDLNEIVGGSEKLIRRVIGEDIVVTVAVQPEVWTVRADPGQLEQVILNLAVNARDAMPEGGSLLVETSNLIAGADEQALFPGLPAGEYVRLLVKDNGVGMSEDVRQQAFEPFFTTKPVGKGTGLGLATVYGIVKQCGGFIRVESESGRGATFQILLPRTLDKPAASTCESTITTTRGSGNILLVEDDRLVRQVVARALRSNGYQVMVAEDSFQALELGRQELGPLDLLVTDVVMPGKGGKELAEELRMLRPGLNVLFVSGYAENAITHEGAVEQGVHFLPKPFTTSGLLGKIRAVLGDSGSPEG